MIDEKEKPPHGAPCNACGLCCKLEICPLGEIVLNMPATPCPELTKTEKGLECGIALTPEKYAPFIVMEYGRAKASHAASLLIGAGKGCDCFIEGEKYDPKISEAMSGYDHAQIDRALKIFKA